MPGGYDPLQLARPVFDVRTFGAVADGTVNSDGTTSGTDNASAIAAAFGALPDLGGGIKSGVVYFPPAAGSYLTSAPFPSVANSTGVTISGSGHATQANYPRTIQPASTVVFTCGAGVGRLIDGRSTSGFLLDGLGILCCKSAFTGIYVDLSHADSGADTQTALIRSCSIGGITDAAQAGACAISLAGAISCVVEKNHLRSVQSGIRGIEQNNVGGVGYSNVHAIRDNQFVRMLVGVMNVGDAWTIQGNTFEGLKQSSPDGMHHAVSFDITNDYVGINGLHYCDNWHGDSFIDNIVWLDLPPCIASKIEINSFQAAGVGPIGIRFRAAPFGQQATGCDISSNVFSFPAGGCCIDFGAWATYFGAGVWWQGGLISGNDVRGFPDSYRNIPAINETTHHRGVQFLGNIEDVA